MSPLKDILTDDFDFDLHKGPLMKFEESRIAAAEKYLAVIDEFKELLATKGFKDPDFLPFMDLFPSTFSL